MSYIESGDENEDEEDAEAFVPVRSVKTKGRQLKRRKSRHVSEEEDIFKDDANKGQESDEGKHDKTHAVHPFFLSSIERSCKTNRGQMQMTSMFRMIQRMMYLQRKGRDLPLNRSIKLLIRLILPATMLLRPRM